MFDRLHMLLTNTRCFGETSPAHAAMLYCPLYLANSASQCRSLLSSHWCVRADGAQSDFLQWLVLVSWPLAVASCQVQMKRFCVVQCLMQPAAAADRCLSVASALTSSRAAGLEICVTPWAVLPCEMRIWISLLAACASAAACHSLHIIVICH